MLYLLVKQKLSHRAVLPFSGRDNPFRAIFSETFIKTSVRIVRRGVRPWHVVRLHRKKLGSGPNKIKSQTVVPFAIIGIRYTFCVHRKIIYNAQFEIRRCILRLPSSGILRRVVW
jgi:hypothetical protein